MRRDFPFYHAARSGQARRRLAPSAGRRPSPPSLYASPRPSEVRAKKRLRGGVFGGCGGECAGAPRGRKGRKARRQGVPREAFQPGDLALPRSLPPRAPFAPCFTEHSREKRCLTRQFCSQVPARPGAFGPRGSRARRREARRGTRRAGSAAAPPAAPRATRRGGPRRRCPQPSRAVRPGWNAPRSTDGGEDRGRRGKRPLPGICSGKSKSYSKKCGLSAPWSSRSNTPLAFCTSDPCVNATRSRAGRSPTDRGRRGQRPTTEPRGRT